MIQINLVPGAELRRPTTRFMADLKLPSLPNVGGDPRMVLGGAGALLAVLLAAYGMWNLGERRAQLEMDLAQEVRDSTGFATTIELVQSLEARQDTIRKKIGIIQEVDQRRYVWPHLLDEIGGAVPTYTWLTEVRSTEAADSLDRSPGVAIQGNAGSTQALTRFMKNLEASAFIRDVTLVTSEQEVVEGRAHHRFSLEARYETPDASVVETVPIVTID